MLDADVRVLLNHNPSEVLGRTKSGTLRLFDEQPGLRFEVDLPASPIGENVQAVRRRDIDGASFRFTVDQESWQGDLRTVESEEELKDVTVATFGPYPAASVELRTRPENNEATKKEQGEVEEQNNTEDARPPAGGRGRRSGPSISGCGRWPHLYADRGYFENRTASVTWDEFRSFTWAAGTALTDLNPVRAEGVGLGYDRRWL